MANKISKSIGIIYKSSFILSKPGLKSLFYSMVYPVYPYLFYCNIVWASTYKTNLRRLVTLQKRVIRNINISAFDALSDPIFKGHRMLKLHDIRLLD